MRVVVVGGGFAGLAAATRLADSGHHVTLLERRPILGGRAYSIVDEETGVRVDNGQHLFMGCYRATRAFLARIGSKLDFDRDLDLSLDDNGTRVRLRSLALPPPFHMLGGLFALGGLRDRLSLLKLAASLKLPTARIPEPSDWETVDAWLDRMGQSAEARRRLWHPLAVATLNDDPRTASAKMLGAVVREALLGSREDARLGVARVGLSELYVDHAARFLAARQAKVHLGAPVEQIVVAGAGGDAVARGVRLKSGEEIGADAVIAAVPPAALLSLIPDSIRAGEPYFEHLPRLSSSPIVSVHLWLDRRLLDVEMLGLCGGRMHWVFDRGTHLSLVASAARDLIELPPDEIVALAARELRRFGSFELVRSRVLKERDATIAHAAGSEIYRPRPRSPVAGLFLAGDFVRTGLPATIESAVRSADEAVTLVSSYQPPARLPSTPGLIAPGRLKRVTGGQ
jgi:squalene-associated FAD-dependent desaturase